MFHRCTLLYSYVRFSLQMSALPMLRGHFPRASVRFFRPDGHFSFSAAAAAAQGSAPGDAVVRADRRAATLVRVPLASSHITQTCNATPCARPPCQIPDITVTGGLEVTIDDSGSPRRTLGHLGVSSGRLGVPMGPPRRASGSPWVPTTRLGVTSGSPRGHHGAPRLASGSPWSPTTRLGVTMGSPADP